MVARRMESRQGHGNGSNGTRIHDPDPKPNPLGRLHSLTLDQIQNQLGDLDKPLGSMNLDELLTSVLLADGVDLGPTQQQSASGPSINRQPSITLTRDLCKKTLDEVWQDIQQEQKQSSLERNDTFSKMTLEDFLIQAGIVAEPPQSKRNVNEIAGLVEPIVIAQPHQATSQWSVNMNMNMNYPQQPNMIPVYVPVQPVPVQPVVPCVNPVVNVSYMEKNQMTVPSSSSCSSSHATSAGALSETKNSRRKRLSPEDIAEKSIQRRQKRMIKNRESATRSRARKQAYTNELENKISCLEEENERLKRQQEWEKVLPTITPPPEPKHQLRRTKSASF